jgi:hypothetical protein
MSALPMRFLSLIIGSTDAFVSIIKIDRADEHSVIWYTDTFYRFRRTAFLTKRNHQEY